MTRESRTLLILGLVAVLGVTSLLLLADRYRRVVESSPHSADVVGTAGDEELRRAAAQQLVDRFVTVRAGVVALVVEHRDELGGADRRRRVAAAIRERKLGALERIGMPESDYELVRRAFVDWRSGVPEVDPLLVGEFEARGEGLARLDLGALEPLDSTFAPTPGS